MAIEQKIDELNATLVRVTETLERLIAALGAGGATSATAFDAVAEQTAASQPTDTGVALAGRQPQPADQPAKPPADPVAAGAVKQNDIIKALMEIGKRFGRNGIVEVLSQFEASTAMDPKLEGRYPEVMDAINEKLAS